MKRLSIYISLLFFTVCLAAPSVAVLSNLKVKEAKVAKLFDMEEEEDARDNDSETQKESDPAEKFFKYFFAAVVIFECDSSPLIHYHSYQYYLTEPIKELITPPPRG